MESIPTRKLTSSMVPEIRPLALDYSVEVREQIQDLWEFALSFDGYAYFGRDEGSSVRLGQFAQSVDEAYRQTGALPSLGEIGMVRACLFYEQRNWCKWGKVMSRMTKEDVTYLAALCEEIRRRLT